MWVSSVSGWVQEEQSDDLFGKCLYNKKYLMGKLQKKVQEAVIGDDFTERYIQGILRISDEKVDNIQFVKYSLHANFF